MAGADRISRYANPVYLGMNMLETGLECVSSTPGPALPGSFRLGFPGIPLQGPSCEEGPGTEWSQNPRPAVKPGCTVLTYLAQTHRATSDYQT